MLSENSELVALISGIAGVLLSLGLTYIPKLNVIWDALEGDTKRMWTGLLLILSTAGIILVSCTALVSVVSCDRAGILDVAFALLMALTGNQATYQLFPAPKAVKEARKYRTENVAVG